MQLSVGSPTISHSAPGCCSLNAFAPNEPVSSPARSRRPNPSYPFFSNALQASYMANICPFASHEPLPWTISPSTTGGIYGGTVSRWLQNTICGFPQLKSRFTVPSPTSNFSTLQRPVCSLSARKSANPASFPEVESKFNISRKSSVSISKKHYTSICKVNEFWKSIINFTT